MRYGIDNYVGIDIPDPMANTRLSGLVIASSVAAGIKIQNSGVVIINCVFGLFKVKTNKGTLPGSLGEVGLQVGPATGPVETQSNPTIS